MESAWLAKRLGRRKSTSRVGVSGGPLTDRENPREGIAFAAGRTDNRSRSPRCIASS